MKFGGGRASASGKLAARIRNCQKKYWAFLGLHFVCGCGHCVVWVWALCGVGVYVCVHIWVYVSFYRTVAVCVYYMDMCVCVSLWVCAHMGVCIFL